MKMRNARWLRSALCLMLAMILALGTCVTAFAEEVGGDEPAETKGKLNYVSVGDSMTNGYCFTGYEQGGKSVSLDKYDLLNDKGIYGEGAYPLQFEAYLEEAGYDVNHTKLAPSALLAGDFWYLLGGCDRPEDNWNGFNDYVGQYKGQYETLRSHFQSAVKDADIMTVCLGNAEFGAFLLQKITESLGVLGATWGKNNTNLTLDYALTYAGLDAKQESVVKELYSTAKRELGSYIPEALYEQYHVDRVCDLLAYTAAGFLVNYKGALNEIVSLNPDVEIIQIGLMNTTYGMKVTMDDGSYIPVGDIMDGVFGLLNAYIAGLPTVMQLAGEWEDATFYYAEQPNPLFISQQFANLKDASWDEIDNGRLSGTTVRDRNITAYNESLRGMIGEAFSMTLFEITLDQVKMFETCGAVVGSDNNPIQGASLSCAIYLAIEDATAASTDTLDIPLSGLEKIVDMTALAGVFSGVNLDQSSYVNLRNSLATYLTSTEELRGMMKIYALFKVGNGMSVHPTPAGHDNIAASVIAAYEANHTSKDQTLENVEALLAQLGKLVETYGPEVAAQIWDQWVEYGYVDMVTGSIEELEAMLKERYEYYTETALPEIEAAVEALMAQQEPLMAQLAALNEQLQEATEQLDAAVEAAANEGGEAAEALKAQLEETVDTIKADIANVEALISEIELQVESLTALADAITTTVTDMETALEDVEEAIGELQVAFEDVVGILADAAEAQAGVLDTIIAAFNAARDTAVAAAEVVEVTMDVASELADDVDAMIEKIAADGAALYAKLAEDLPACYAVLVGYYEQLPEELRTIIEGALAEALEAGKAALESETQKKLDELYNQYSPLIEAKKAELEALQSQIAAQVEAKKAELEQAYNDALVELQAQKAELEAAAQAQIAELQAQIEAKRAELENAAEEAVAEIEAALAELDAQVAAKQQELAEALAEIDAAIAQKQQELQNAIDAITAEVSEQYAEALAQLESALNELQGTYDEAVAAAQDALATAIAEMQAAVAEQLEALADGSFAQIEGYLEQLNISLENAQTALNELVTGSIESVEELAAALEGFGAAAMEDINAAVEQLLATVETMLYQATHADIVAEDEFKYVALGDGSAEAEGYVELLAAMLEKDAGDTVAVSYVNNAKAGRTVADELNDLEALAAKVYDADLVTLGYSDVTFLLNALQNTTVADWSDYVEDEYVPYIEQLVAEIQAELVESVGDETKAVYATTLANAMAFSAVQYAVELPMLAAAVHEINPEAVIVIVGMYNPLKDATVVIGDASFDISDYIDYLVEAVAVHGMAYSLISGNSIYVDARDVNTASAGATLDLGDYQTLVALLTSQLAAMYPSATGDEYIAQQIADALNITYTSSTSGLLGDADSDGKITTYDATLILQYKSGRIDASQLNLAVCDVDGDGKITTYDATLILQYKSGRIEKFPVEV